MGDLDILQLPLHKQTAKLETNLSFYHANLRIPSSRATQIVLQTWPIGPSAGCTAPSRA